MKKLISAAGIACTILAGFVSCGDDAAGDYGRTENQENIYELQTDGFVGNPENREAPDQEEKTGKPEEDPEEDIVRQVCERVQSIDFSVQQYPVNKEIFDAEMEKKYKEAFLEILLNKEPVEYRDGEAVYYRDGLYGVGNADDDEWMAWLKHSGYHYLDFDGDGMPELIINNIYPYQMKYNHEEECVDSRVYGGEDWYVLGSGKLYFRDPTSAGMMKYAYAAYDGNGEVTEYVKFYIVYYGDWEEGSNKYLVSVDEFKDVDVGWENWKEITKDFFDAVDNALQPVTYEDVFGGMAGE